MFFCRRLFLCRFFFFLFFLLRQPFLQADGFRLARIDGKMTNKQRQAELRRFCGKGDDSSADVREGGTDSGDVYVEAL